MKIDKVVFSCSEEFSPFWNTQSWVWKEKLGVEPVCILWGKVKNTNMSDKYGEIIEKEYSSFWNKSFQLTWSKFFHTGSESDTTWLIGDIDLIPLQTDWFTDKISSLDEDIYTHLAYGSIADAGNRSINTFERYGGFANRNNGMDVAAYYHLAKGKTFIDALNLNDGSFDEQVERVINSKEFGMGKVHGLTEQECYKRFGHIPIPREELYYWVADENYSSYCIFNAMQSGKIRFKSHITPWHCQGSSIPKTPMKSSNPDHCANSSKRLDRCWMRDPSTYIYDKNELEQHNYIDIHCQRPFELQKDSLKEIFETAWGDWFE